MPTTQADIYNRALAHLGEIAGQEIDDVAEGSANANALNRFYPDSLEAFLEEEWWGFARKYAVLSLDASTPPEHWTYAYTFPADNVEARFLVGDAPEDRIEWERGTNQNGLAVIWTDRKDAQLCYTGRVENFNSWGGAARLAFTLKLASDAVPGFSGGSEKANLLQNRYEFQLEKAVGVSQNSGEPRREDHNEFIDERHGEGPTERFSSRFDYNA